MSQMGLAWREGNVNQVLATYWEVPLVGVYDPRGQMVHEEEARLEKVPAGQVRHVLCPEVGE